MNKLININDNGKVTARELYDFLGMDKSNFSRWAKANIDNNIYAEELIDFIPFVIDDERNPNPMTDYELSIDFAKKLCMVSKSERGEQARNYFIAVEKMYKEQKQDLAELSPQLQLLINMELQQKEQAKQIHELRLVTTKTKEEIQGIRNVISLNVKNWRDNIRFVINSIARKVGEGTNLGESIRNITTQSYDMLDKRLGVSLKRRLTELKKRLALEGATQTKVKEANYLDVIAKDKKLTEGYLAIIKELAVKYGVSVKDDALKEGVAQ